LQFVLVAKILGVDDGRVFSGLDVPDPNPLPILRFVQDFRDGTISRSNSVAVCAAA
jgi:hypothetical protein